MDKITPFLDQIIAVGGPYLPSIGVFMLTYFVLGMFEELINIRGLWKWLLSIIVAVLFFHYWDNVTLRFEAFLQLMGMTPVTPGKFK